MDSSATRKRKMKKPPAPPRAAKAQPAAKRRTNDKSKKIIEVEEDASELRHMVQFPGSSSSRSDSDSDHPSTSTSTSTSSSTFSDGRNGLSQSSEELSVYDYEGWEDPLVIVNPRPSPGIPPLTTYSGFDYSGLVYPLPPVFKNPLPPLYYRPKFPDPH